MAGINTMTFRGAVLSLVGAMSMAVSPALAQVRSVDPDIAIDGDLMGGETALSSEAAPVSQSYPAYTPTETVTTDVQPSIGNGTPVDSWSAESIGAQTTVAAEPANTYKKDDLIGAAEGVFGKGAQGLATMIEDLLSKQGEPNGYIVGREGGGAFIFGLRYGSGTLHHKVEGERSVYWTGPSLGIDAGLNAGNSFVLVYNLHDSQDLYHRYGAGEGQAYLVGGFNVSYLRRGDTVLIPVRMGAGLRLGANVGYMKFSEKQRWLPF
ncbi:MAG: DUF1134 domain-containing protein [Novosphingobium sp.]|nr:DUF1134 domain-containing protein [Novosphingobium sp.]